MDADDADLFLQLICVSLRKPAAKILNALGKFYGQAERAISTGKLNPSLGLHVQPIKQVVFLCPSYPFWDWEILSWGGLHAYMPSAFIPSELRYPAVPLA